LTGCQIPSATINENPREHEHNIHLKPSQMVRRRFKI